MKHLDDQLKDALRRKEPPAGFAERALERAGRAASPANRLRAAGVSRSLADARHRGEVSAQRRSLWGRRSGGPAIGVEPDSTSGAGRRVFMRWAAAAAVVAALAGGLEYRAIQRERDERARGEAAKEQVVQALHIVSSKLQLVQSKVKGIGS